MKSSYSKKKQKTLEAPLLSIYHINMYYIHADVKVKPKHNFHVFTKKEKGPKKKKTENEFKSRMAKRIIKKFLIWAQTMARHIIEIDEKNIIKNGIKVGILILLKHTYTHTFSPKIKPTSFSLWRLTFSITFYVSHVIFLYKQKKL